MAGMENQEPLGKTTGAPTGNPSLMVVLVGVRIIAGYCFQQLLPCVSLIHAHPTLVLTHTRTHPESRMELYAHTVSVSPGHADGGGLAHREGHMQLHAPRQCGTDPTRLTASSFTMVSSFLTGTSGSMFTTTSPVG